MRNRMRIMWTLHVDAMYTIALGLVVITDKINGIRRPLNRFKHVRQFYFSSFRLTKLKTADKHVSSLVQINWAGPGPTHAFWHLYSHTHTNTHISHSVFRIWSTNMNDGANGISTLTIWLLQIRWQTWACMQKLLPNNQFTIPFFLAKESINIVFGGFWSVCFMHDIDAW